jgi:hypothetical protein
VVPATDKVDKSFKKESTVVREKTGWRDEMKRGAFSLGRSRLLTKAAVLAFGGFGSWHVTIFVKLNF